MIDCRKKEGEKRKRHRELDNKKKREERRKEKSTMINERRGGRGEMGVFVGRMRDDSKERKGKGKGRKTGSE